MTVSRHYGNEGEDEEMNPSDYLDDKKECQDRTGYPERTQEELEGKAVDEKLPDGSQSY